MDQFLTFNAFQLIQLVVMVGGGFWAVSALKSAPSNQAERLEKVEEELYELRKVVVSIARQEERANAADQRSLAQGQRIDAQGERLTAMDQRILTMRTQIDEMLRRERYASRQT